jgi:hypothetical protein
VLSARIFGKDMRSNAKDRAVVCLKVLQTVCLEVIKLIKTSVTIAISSPKTYRFSVMTNLQLIYTHVTLQERDGKQWNFGDSKLV